MGGGIEAWSGCGENYNNTESRSQLYKPKKNSPNDLRAPEPLQRLHTPLQAIDEVIGSDSPSQLTTPRGQY